MSNSLECIDHYLGVISARMKDVHRHADDMADQINALKAERDEATSELRREVPRFITADELEAGTAIATFADDGFPVAGVVTGHAGCEFSLLMHSDMLQTFSKDRTLMLIAEAPGKPGVTAEDIRNSEPGSTWELVSPLSGTSTWEWDGEGIRLHSYDGGLGGGHQLEWLFGDGLSITRSSAAPRGVYSKPELPTEQGSVVLVTEFKSTKLEEPIYALLDHQELWNGATKFPGTTNLARPHEITGFKPARIVGDYSKTLSVGDQVTTVDQLESLPFGTVLEDHRGAVWVLRVSDVDWWWERTADEEGYDHLEVAKYAPLTVLYLPEEDA